MKMYVQRCGCTALAASGVSLAYITLTYDNCMQPTHACRHAGAWFFETSAEFCPDCVFSGPVMPRTRAVRVRVQGLEARFMPGRAGSGGADGFIMSGRSGAKGGYTGTWVGDEIRGAVRSVMAILRF
jgi:hypothetical protein